MRRTGNGVYNGLQGLLQVDTGMIETIHMSEARTRAYYGRAKFEQQ